MEKDFETANDDFPIAIGIGARIYDGRLGRWLALDPIKVQSWSNYVSFKNSPISIIDPTGETDFYNLLGIWIGTDGVDNKVQTVITDKVVAKDIVKHSKKGLDYKAEIPNESYYQLPERTVITAIVEVFEFSNNDVLNKDGKIIRNAGSFEVGTTFDKDGNQTNIAYGREVNSYSEAAHVSLPESGSISIHTHPTTDFINRLTKKTKSYNADPSPKTEDAENDIGLFKNFDLNIIIGYNNLLYEIEEGLPGGGKITKDSPRTLVVNFFNKAAEKLFSISYSALENIANGNSGKYKKKYDKAKKKAANSSNNVSGTAG